MPLRIEWAVIDCHDLELMSSFWQEALDFEHELTGPSGGHLLVAKNGSGSRLGLIPTPDAKLRRPRTECTSTSAPKTRKLKSIGWSVLARPG